MIRNHLLPVSALLVVAFAATISAQQQPTRPPAAQPTPPAASASASVNLPNGRMAVIYTDAFLDAKTGILKFNSLVTKLNGEFQKPKDDIQAMQTRGQALETEINKLQNAPEGTPIDQRSLQAKIDQLEQLKKDIQRKGEDAQASYNKRRQELFGPLQDEIARALETFAKASTSLALLLLNSTARIRLLPRPARRHSSTRFGYGDCPRLPGNSKAAAASLSLSARRSHH
jgi:Skp family chaperone for outer membrane proteins